MITHRQIIANLGKHDRDSLLMRSNRAGLAHLAGHLGALMVSAAWIIFALPLWQMALLIHGILLIFLFALLHECIHKTPFASQSLNSAIAAVCGFVLLLPSQWFTYFHLAHHRHTHDLEHDLELAHPKPGSLWQYIRYLSGLPVWWSQLRVLAMNPVSGPRDDFIPQGRREGIRREARISIVLYGLIAVVCLANDSDLLVWLWLIPGMLGQPFLRGYLLAEHTLCPHVSNMLENSRTTFAGRAIRFIAWNMPYHAEHHVNPAVPFHKLPEFHQIVKQHLRVTENGYVQFHRRLALQLRKD